MDQTFERYAIFWTPEPGTALARFGEAWFGENGPQETFGLPPDLAARATGSPARYRTHATLKAPFRPTLEVRATDIAATLEAFCTRRRAVQAGGLRLAQFSRYLALVLQPPMAEAEWLAAECVTAFDRFRAPLTDADRARRNASLTPVEAANFETYGYPYVLSAFEFHISLAGPLEKPELDAVQHALEPALQEIIAAPRFDLESLTLLGDPGNAAGARFEILSRHPFMGRRGKY